MHSTQPTNNVCTPSARVFLEVSPNQDIKLLIADFVIARIYIHFLHLHSESLSIYTQDVCKDCGRDPPPFLESIVENLGINTFLRLATFPSACCVNMLRNSYIN